MQISQDRIVYFDYTLTDDSGKTLDTSVGKRPLGYMHGRHGIILGLEKAMEGKSTGDSFKVSIAPEEAYGPHRPDLTAVIDRKQFTKNQPIVLGAVVTSNGPKGQKMQARIAKITPEGILLDGNHPLAGKTLHFEVTVTEVRAAEIEELADGKPMKR
jgi:FKBP-type peptidyl-prolyl cis-trans isomerase SlyD